MNPEELTDAQRQLINELMASVQAFYGPTGNAGHRALPEIFTAIQALLTLDNLLYLVANGDVLINDDIDSGDITNLITELPLETHEQRQLIVTTARQSAVERNDLWAITLLDEGWGDYNLSDGEGSEEGEEGVEAAGVGIIAAGAGVPTVLATLFYVEESDDNKDIMGEDLPPDS